jgi:heme/copper-type cytochrome/quinol oxidase subunit 2
MIANALIVTIAILLALAFWLMGQLKFLIPYRSILIHQYGAVILAWFAILFVNIFAAVYVMQREFFLKDTGRKLSHLDKQVISGQAPVPPPTYDEQQE